MRPSCYNLHRDWTHKYTKSWKRSETHHSNCTLSQISEMDTNCTTTTTTHMGKIVDEELHAILGLEGPILNHPFIQNLPVERHSHKFISLAHRVSLAIFFVIPRWLYHIIGKSYLFLLMILLGSYDHIKIHKLTQTL